MKRILVLGSANIDIVLATQSLPKPGETVMGSDVERHFGGKGANQAVAARRLGGEVEFGGVVGSDSDGQMYTNHLRKENIGLRGLRTSHARPTGCALITVDAQGTNTIVVAPGANGAFLTPLGDSVEEAIRQAEYILLQFEIPAEANVAIIERARGFGKKVILNPSPMNVEFFQRRLPIDTIILNETELGSITGGGDSKDEAALAKHGKDLLAFNIRCAVLTRGALGAMCITEDDAFSVPAPKIEPVDTVGAGDTFAGAYAVALAEGKDAREAIYFANHAAALSALKRGAQSSIPTRAEVMEFIQKQRN
ncbi:ribokinase [bacterium]|nr:ribokinase [bacterium]